MADVDAARQKVESLLTELTNAVGGEVKAKEHEAIQAVKEFTKAVQDVRDAKGDTTKLNAAKAKLKTAIDAVKDEVQKAKKGAETREAAEPSRLVYRVGKINNLKEDLKIITANGTTESLNEADLNKLLEKWYVIEGLDDYLVSRSGGKFSLLPKNGGQPIPVSGSQGTVGSRDTLTLGENPGFVFRAGYVYYRQERPRFTDRHTIYRFRPSASPPVSRPLLEVYLGSFAVDANGNVLGSEKGKNSDTGPLKLYLAEGNFTESIALSLDGTNPITNADVLNGLDGKVYVLETKPKSGNSLEHTVQLYVLGAKVQTPDSSASTFSQNKNYVVSGKNRSKFVTITPEGTPVDIGSLNGVDINSSGGLSTWVTTMKTDTAIFMERYQSNRLFRLYDGKLTEVGIPSGRNPVKSDFSLYSAQGKKFLYTLFDDK